MVPARPASDPSDKRERILDAALALFAERGFHGTPVPMIAERAGVGAGTIYRYFEGKEAVVNALYRREKEAMLAAVLEGLPVHLSPRAQFHHFFRKVVDFARDRRDSFQFLEHHHHAPYLDEQSRALEQRAVSLAHAFLAETARQQITKPVAPEVPMAVVWGGIVQLMKDAWAGRVELGDDILSQAEDLFWEAVRL